MPVVRAVVVSVRHRSLLRRLRCDRFMLGVGGAMLGADNGAGDTSRPFRRAVNTLDALGLTPRTFRGLAGTPSLSRMAIGTGQPHSSSRETEGGHAVAVGMRRPCVLEGAREAEPFAVLADVASAVATHLAQTTRRTGLARLLGGSVGRVGGSSISGNLGGCIRCRHLNTHVFHVHAVPMSLHYSVGTRELGIASFRIRRLMQFRLAMGS